MATIELLLLLLLRTRLLVSDTNYTVTGLRTA